ncbi:MAG: hypothetical protein KY475_19915 [Planctomycetes bacterium]|nr:hypothetical protein [Planctomycetota bacterium]
MARNLFPGEVLYIGPPPVNRLGKTGLWTSVLGLVTCGLLSPVGLFLSFAALGKKPRGAAMAGLLIGLLGSLWIAFLGSLAVGGAMSAAALEQARLAKRTEISMVQAEGEVMSYKADVGRLPEGIEGNKLVLQYTDAWQNPLRYDLEDDGRFAIRSAGPDTEFDTKDDLLRPHEPAADAAEQAE